MRKEDVRAVYDGSIFYKKAEEHVQREKAKSRAQGREGFLPAIRMKNLHLTS